MLVIEFIGAMYYNLIRSYGKWFYDMIAKCSAISSLLGIDTGVTSVIGSGGKTTLIRLLAKELSSKGKTLVVTSTHMFPFEDMTCLVSPTAELISQALHKEGCVQAGILVEGGKLSFPSVSWHELLETANYILCEADGSRGLPIKAHLEHEPVIPECSKRIIQVVGADGFYRRIKDVCHRSERYCELTGDSADFFVTPTSLARLLRYERLCDLVFVNKAESEEAFLFAEALKKASGLPVYAGSLLRGEWICL